MSKVTFPTEAGRLWIPVVFFRLMNRAFHQPHTRAYRITESVVWALIILSSILFIVEMVLTTQGRPIPRALLHADHIVLACFALELSLRVIFFYPPITQLFKGGLSSRLRRALLGRMRYVLTPLFLVDLLAVLALVPVLRGLRALRLLRLLRGVHLFRYSSPFLGILRTFQENALLYMFTFGFLLFVVLVGGITIFLVERDATGGVRSISDGIWWAMVTITTVGFGDITPVTPQGRLVAGVVMVMGMFTLALFAGLVGSTLLRVLTGLRKDQFRMSMYTNHIVICGYDPGAALILEALLEENPARQNPLVVFGAGDRPVDLPPDFIWISGDPSKESELDKVRLSHARAAIIVGSRLVPPSQADAANILVAFTLRSYMSKQKTSAQRIRPLYIVAEILDPENVGHALTAGADEVVETTRLGFSLLAHAALVPGSGKIMSQVASAGAHSLYIEPIPYSETLTYAELSQKIHGKHGVALIGVRDPQSGAVELTPRDDARIPPDWEVVYLGRDAVLKK